MNTYRNLVLLITLVLSAFSYANDVELEKITRDIAIEKDGTFVQTNTMIMRLVTEAGAKGVGQIPIPFSDSLQELEIVEAYSIKPDGTRVDVKKEAIFTQAAPIAISAPMFNDIKFRIIVFSEPMAGGKVGFVVRIKQKTPFFPGHFSAIESLPLTLVQDNTEIKLSAPADYSLKLDVRGYEGGLVETKAGRTHWKWTLKNAVARKPEPFEIAEIDFGSYVAISSFTDWADLGKAYLARVEDKLKPTEALKLQAADIVKGAKDKREEVKMIHEWVARNVRYVGVFLGLGGFVPRQVEQIIETKYGDCKDHTTLMMALLRARDIEATTALIQTANMYQLPKVPVVGAFNHAITYVPQFDLYLDGTSEHTRWDVLPLANAGKSVLLTGLGKIASTPNINITVERVSNVIKLAIAENGTLTGTTTTSTGGNHESYLRAVLANIPAGGEEKWVANWIRGAGPQATAKMTKSNPRDHATPQKFEMAF
jgi:transglutaminase-like putative cysteine protease